MKRSVFYAFAVLLTLISIPTSVNAQSDGMGTISGNVFGDYYWFAQSHNSSLDGKHGFRFRRIYFTYENDLDENFSTRLRLEMSNPGNFTTPSRMVPVVKDAYLKWETGAHKLYLGIAKTPRFALTEKVWRYRPLEKAPLDLQMLGSSRDFGIAAKGPIDEQGEWRYHAMIGNGSGTRAEINQGKMAMLSVSYHPSDDLVFEFFGDLHHDTWYTLKGFAAYQSEDITVGIDYIYQNREWSNQSEQTLASVFSHFTITDAVRGVLRVDHSFTPLPYGGSIDYIPFDVRAEPTFALAGLDFTVIEKFHIMPNIETIVYGENPNGLRPDTDIMPRLTFSYRF